MPGRRRKTNATDLSELRARAERAIRARVAAMRASAPEDVQQLVHELEVYQVELEVQNESLRESQRELEASRDRYVELYEFAPVGYVTLDSKGAIHQINLTGAKLLGAQRTRLIGHLFAQYIAKGYKLEFREHLRHLTAEASPSVCEVVICPKSGSPIPVKLTTIRVKDDAGAMFRTTLTDISKRKQAEEALERSEERFRLAAAATNDAIWDYDVASGTVWWNEAYDRLFSRPPDTASSWQWWIDRIHPRDRETVVRSLLTARDGTATNWSAEYRFQRGDGTWAFIFDRCYIARNARGRAVRMLGAMLDLTDRVQAEQALREARDKLEIRVRERTAELRENLRKLRTEIRNREKADRALQESEQRFRAIVDNAVDGIVLADPESLRLSAANQRICTMLGYTRDEFDRLSVPDIHPKEDLGLVLDEFGKHLKGEVTLSPGLPLQRKDGSICYADVSAFPITVAEKRYLAGNFRDVTERRAMEFAVRLSEEKYRALAETTSDIPLSIDVQGTVAYVGPQVSRYGLDPERIVGRNFVYFVLESDRSRVIAEFQQAVYDNRDFATEFRVQGADEAIYWFEQRSRPQQDAEGKVTSFSGVLRDFTERKLLEKATAEMAARERRRFGQNLHDGLGQDLAGLGYLAGLLQGELSAEGHAQSELAGRLTDGIRAAISSVRAIARGLVPVEVEAGGLMVALEQLAASTQARTGIECHFTCDGDVTLEDNDVATELFRIAGEAVNNATKHARARRIEMELAGGEKGSISLWVRDDGVGLPAEPGTAEGLGLRIMQYRASIIGAILHVGPADGQGTQVLCTLAGES